LDIQASGRGISGHWPERRWPERHWPECPGPDIINKISQYFNQALNKSVYGISSILYPRIKLNLQKNRVSFMILTI
jgi:hypothetical protein